VAVAFVIFLLGLQIVIVTIIRFSRGSSYEVEDQFYFNLFELEYLALYIAFPSAIAFGILTVIKFKYADFFASPALRKDGFCSLAGTLLSVALLLEYLISDLNPTMWWLDPVIALFVGVALLGIGMRTVFLKNRELPLSSISWWISSPPSVSESNSPSLGPPNGVINSSVGPSAGVIDSSLGSHDVEMSTQEVSRESEERSDMEII